MTKLIAVTGAALALVLLAGDSARAETWQRNWTGPKAWTAQQQCIAVPMAADTT
jgi:hypothetical protein